MSESDKREFTFRRKDFQYLSGLIYDQTGIVLADHKFDMMYARLARRLRFLGLRSVKNYIDYFSSPEGVDELPNLINAMTTNLTRFFRETHHFDTLRDRALKPIAANAAKGPKDSVRIWSAGCSSGMEPYSIAMTVAESLPNVSSWDALILATDIDTKMLNHAREGIYPKTDTEEIPAHMRKKYMYRESPDSLRMDRSLRDMIRFNRLNLLHDWPMKKLFDVIFCRNVLIYFDQQTREKLVSRFVDQLVPGGYLFLGHSEALAGEKTSLKNVGRSSFRKVAHV